MIGKNCYKFNSENMLEFVELVNKKDTKLTIPSAEKIGGKTYKVTSIAKNAVDKTRIKTAAIGKYVKKIGDKAFQKCTSLTKVTFKGKNITMGADVFSGCKKLKTVEGGIGSSFTVGKYKYKITEKSMVTVTGLKSADTKAVSIGATVKLGAKPYKITSVADVAFVNTKITSAILGKNIKKIGRDAFYNCSSLKSVNFKGSNLLVEDRAFGLCKNLRTIKGAINSTFIYALSKYKMISDSELAFIGVASELSKKDGYFIKKISISPSIAIGAKSYKITKIADKAFSGVNIKEIYIGENITSIGERAFENCKRLELLSVKSEKITFVGEKAFDTLNSDVKVSIPFTKLDTYRSLFKEAGMPEEISYHCWI